MWNLDYYIETNVTPEAGAYYYLRDSDAVLLETLEGVLADLVEVQNFAQLRKAIADRRVEIASMLNDRERARVILRGEDA